MASRSRRWPPPTRPSRSPCPRRTLVAPTGDAVYATYLDAMLQKGVADYELAQTYPVDSADRTRYLKAALEQFEVSVQELPRADGRPGRPDVAGQVLRGAGGHRRRDRPLQAAPAAHAIPGSAALQRNVGYFYIVALAKRKQSALAADEATRWLAKFNQREERRSKEGLGVQLELAKAIDAQMPEIDGQRPAQGQEADHRHRQPGGPIRLAVQERRPCPAQEIQAQRGGQGRGDRPPHLPGCHGAGRRCDRLPRMGPRHHPAQGGGEQGRTPSARSRT